MSLPTKIAFIGGGNMTHCLIGGLRKAGFPAETIWVSNPHLEKLQNLRQQFAIHTNQDNKVAARDADIIIFAVKPTVMPKVCQELSSLIHQQQPLIISVAAGIEATTLQNWLGDNIAIIRSMPNTPALVSSGVTGLFANAQTTFQQRELAESIFRTIGIVLWLQEETLLHSLTALSGCGPAYIFLLMEALQHAAVTLGLNTQDAYLLTLHTVFGAAKMALESMQDISTLRHQVTSPNGVTESAINYLQRADISSIFLQAMQTAKQRSEEIARTFAETK